MATEITPTRKSVSFDTEQDGRPRENYLYKEDLNQRFRYGKRVMTFDGRVFRYSRSKTATYSGYGAANYFTVSKHITYAVLPVAIAVGDLFATVTYPSSAGYGAAGFLEDELVGGYIVVGHNTTSVENRVIVANDAMSATTSTARIWVDGAFQTANSVSNGAEIYPNPYAYLGKGALEYNAFMGVPAINTTILYSSFVQTWGPCWVVPGGGDATPGNTVNDRTAYFVGDGSVNFGTALTVETGYQMAGFCIDTTSSAVSAMPLIMLQITP
jgi:hypothetical protein